MGIFYFLLASFIAGLNLVAIKYGLKDLNPFMLMFLRFSTATLVLYFIHIAKRKNKPLNFLKLRKAIITSLYSSIALLFIGLGINLSTVSNTQIILALLPTFVSFGAHITTNEKHNNNKTLSLLLGLGGTLLIIFRSQPYGTTQDTTILGNLLVLGSTFFSTIYIFKSKKLSTNYSPFEMTMSHSIATTLVFGIAVLLSTIVAGADAIPKLTIPAVISLGYLVLVGTVINFYAYQKSIELNEAFVVGLANYAQLPVAILGGILVFGDVIDFRFLVGTFLIIASSLVGAKFQKTNAQILSPSKDIV